MSRLVRAVAFATAFTLASATCPSAFAADTAATRAEAKKHFQRAVTLYEEQDFRAALAEFQRAYEIAPNYKLLYDIAQANYQLQAYSKAIDAFEQYLKSGEREIPRARRIEVEESLARLRARVATLTIKVNVPTAEVTVDEQVVSTQAGSVSLKVNAGQHRVVVTAKGYVTANRSLNLVGEDKTDLRVDLEPEAETAPGPSAPVSTEPTRAGDDAIGGNTLAPPQDAPRGRTAYYIGLGTTTVLAAGAVGFGIASLVAKGTYDRALSSSTDSPQRIDNARDLVRTTSVVADALTLGAVAAGVTTVVLYFTTGRRSPSAATAAGLRVQPCPAGVCGTF